LTWHEFITLSVLLGVVGTLIWGKLRTDVVALAGAAILLLSGAVKPIDAQEAFASPALVALASLFVIAYALEISGLLDAGISFAVRMCRKAGQAGMWGLIFLSGFASAFLNNSPIVVMMSPVVRDVAESLSLNPRRYLIPLSYVTVLGGCCTLIGTSTNLIVSQMGQSLGQIPFGLFEITPVGICVALSGALYLMMFSRRTLDRLERGDGAAPTEARPFVGAGGAAAEAGRPELFATHRPLNLGKALISLAIFVAVVVAAGMGWAPIAAAAFAGAVALIVLGVMSAEEAYGGLRPDILLLIAGMLVIGVALEKTGLAQTLTQGLVFIAEPAGPLIALFLLYGLTLFLTELLSNATVAVLLTPISISLAESLSCSPRPFLVAVMMAASAAFATPFGYQTNTLVYKMGSYGFMDFVRVGLPLNAVTWAAAMVSIPIFFPF